MIGALWSRLPFPWWAKWLLAIALIAGAAALCHFIVFPAVDGWLFPVEQVTVPNTPPPTPTTP